jgi:sodium transport system permease protein
MNLNLIKIIFLKELLETLRDKRTIIMMILTPIIFPIMVAALPALTISQLESTFEDTSDVSIIGRENGMELYYFIMESNDFNLVEINNDINNSIIDGDIGAVLIIPEDFEEHIENETTVNLTIVYDSTRMKSISAAVNLDSRIQEFNDEIVIHRIEKRGIDPIILEPIETEGDDVAPKDRTSGIFLAFMLPLVMVMWILIGGMTTAVDITAGEKERRTLETLLIKPPSRIDIVLGKFLTLFTITLINTVLITVSIILPAIFVSGILFGSSELYISPLAVVILIITLLLLAALINSIQITIGIFAKSVKEANQYLAPLSFIAIIPAMILPIIMLTGEVIPEVFFAIPIINVIFLLQEILVSSFDLVHIGLVLLSNGLCTIISFVIANKMFKNEKVLFRT